MHSHKRKGFDIRRSLDAEKQGELSNVIALMQNLDDAALFLCRVQDCDLSAAANKSHPVALLALAHDNITRQIDDCFKPHDQRFDKERVDLWTRKEGNLTCEAAQTDGWLLVEQRRGQTSPLYLTRTFTTMSRKRQIRISDWSEGDSSPTNESMLVEPERMSSHNMV